MSEGSPPPLSAGPELLAFADALTTGFRSDPRSERDSLVAAVGPEAAERAVGVAATFQMMNRILDGVGAPVSPHLADVGQALGFEPDQLPI